ncbi:stage V sporulation protein AA [Bacillus timonensis]|nr:stage V sporulation protein AA [Bacillus timonensis]
MENTIYLRLRHRIQVRPNQVVKIGDIAQVVATNEVREAVMDIVVHRINLSDKNIVVIDIMRVIKEIQSLGNDFEIQTIGPTQTLVEIVFKKRTFTPMYLVIIWFLLFIGAALAIMNFHEDVSMQQVHQRIYTIITGEEIKKPLLLQIPYSIGLGLGMVLFFNHLFRKRLNEEPSPLEVEMFNYQQDLDLYMIMNENKESMKKIDDN